MGILFLFNGGKQQLRYFTSQVSILVVIAFYACTLGLSADINHKYKDNFNYTVTKQKLNQ